jgi:hypothetical protein
LVELENFQLNFHNGSVSEVCKESFAVEFVPRVCCPVPVGVGNVALLRGIRGAELPKLVKPVEFEGVWKGGLYLVFQERLAVALEPTVVLYLALPPETEPPRTCEPVEFKNANV